MLRFMTCGAVDNGKSTLLGRILKDSDVIMKDQAVDDLAHVFDGLEEERARGITIDVAYGFFRTKKRTFLMADAPGHAEFLPNMVTAATQVDVAILLIDVEQGVSAQTFKHAEVLDFIGVSKVIVAVNKMDRVDFKESAFEAIKKEFEACSYQFDRIYIPISAYHGDNVTSRSKHLKWYEGKSILKTLETIEVETSPAKSHIWATGCSEEGWSCGLDNPFEKSDHVFTVKGLQKVVDKDGWCLKFEKPLERGELVSTVPLKPLDHYRVCALGFFELKNDQEYIIQFQHQQVKGVLKSHIAVNQFVHTQIVLNEAIVAQDYALVIDASTYATMGVLKIEPSLFWFTGRSGSGKTTLAQKAVSKLSNAVFLDADLIRQSVNTDLGLEEKDRIENVRRISEIAYVLMQQGFIVFVACIAPYKKQREQFKLMFPMAEIFVSTPLAECEKRDPKGLYKKGIGPSPYEEPDNPDLRIDTVTDDIDTCVVQIVDTFKLTQE